MAKTVVVEKDGVKKTVPEEYKKDFIIAGWTEATETNNVEVPYSYTPTNSKI